MTRQLCWEKELYLITSVRRDRGRREREVYKEAGKVGKERESVAVEQYMNLSIWFVL